MIFARSKHFLAKIALGIFDVAVRQFAQSFGGSWNEKRLRSLEAF
jgi:hypothetical protein